MIYNIKLTDSPSYHFLEMSIPDMLMRLLLAVNTHNQLVSLPEII